MAKKVINSFNAGELSPYLYARSDVDKYSSGCLTMENFVPLPYGGATRRPALEYKFAAVDDDKVRLVPFTFSVADTYLLVIGDEEINIYQDTTLKDTITAPWEEGELDEIKYCQSADVMWFVHPDHPVQRLERTSDTSWSIADVEFDYPPLLDENEDDIFLDLTFSETAWATSTAYVIGDIVQFDGVVYKCIAAHTSDGSAFANDYRNGVWIASNKGRTATLNSYDAVSGGSNYNLFTANDVGRVVRLSNIRNTAPFQSSSPVLPLRCLFSETFTNIYLNGATLNDQFISAAINVSNSNWEASISINTSGIYKGTYFIERSLDNGDTWEIYVTIASLGEKDLKSFSASSDSEESSNVWIRIRGDDIDASTALPNISLTVDSPYIEGLAEITAYTDAHTVTVSLLTDVQQELSAGITGTAQDKNSTQAFTSTRTKEWSWGAFSDASGYPKAVALFENRLCFGGTDDSPSRLWMSQTDDYQNFLTSDIATGAIDLTLNSGQIDEIRWMVPQEQLVIGTAGSEWSLGADDERKAVSPTGFNLKRKTTYGTNGVQGLLINSAVLFLMRQSRKVREWTPNYNAQDYVAPDLSILAEHITKDGITEWAYQQQPDNVLWSIRGDGALVGFTYERDQNVTGWHRHSNDGFEFESVAVLPRDNEEDEVWVSVKITVNSVVKRYIARLCDREWGTDYTSEWKGSDLWVDYQSSGDAAHLIGKTVELVVDGVPKGTQVVDGSGNVTGATGTVNIVGLPFTSTLAPLYLVSDNQYGTSRGSRIGNRSAIIRFKDTYSAKVGQTTGSLEDVIFDPDESALYDGDAPARFDNANDWLLTTYITQSQPMPCTVLAMIPDVEDR